MSKLNKKKLERKLEKYMKEGKLENAIKTANRLSRMDPNEKIYIMAKANCFELLEKYENAANEYKNVLKLSDNDMDFYCLICSKLAEIDRYEDLLYVIEEGLKIDPNHEVLVLDKARVLLFLDRIADAYKYIDEFSKTSDYWKDLLLIKVDAEIDFGNSEKAIEICDEILKEGMDIDVLNKKVMIYVELDLIDNAIELLDPLLDDEEYKNFAVSIKAILYDENDESDKALSLINDQIMENPKDSKLNTTKGFILLNMGEYEESEKYLRNSFEEDQTSEDEINLIIATIFCEYGKFERALELTELIPDDSDWYDLSQALENRIYGEMDESDEHIQNEIYEILNNASGSEREDILEDFTGADPRMPFERNIFKDDIKESDKLIEEAWNEKNPRKKKKLAKEAIKLDKYAIDAYNVLAYGTPDINQASKYFKKAIDLFHETHDAEYFEDVKGYFWGYVETRPFMRAMNGYADTLLLQGNEKDAASWYEYMIELNPGDNQGVRYSLLNVLFTLNRLDDVVKVFDEYDEECSTHFIFSKLLWAIKSQHDEKYVEELYKEAVESNEYVVPFLLGKKRMPSESPRYYSPGDSSEAIEYLDGGSEPWKQDKLALKTLEYLDVKHRVKNK